MHPADTPTGARRTPWRALDGVLAFIGGAVLGGVAFAVAPAEGVAGVFGVLLPAQCLGSMGILAWIGARREPWREALRWSAAWSDLVGIPIGLGLQVLLSLTAATIAEVVFDFEPPTQEVITDAAAASSSWEWLLIVVGVVVLAPIAEELVFRGAVLKGLERYGSRAAVGGSAALFAAAHLFDPNAVFAFPLLLILGVVMAREVLRTGRLGRAIATHAGFNLMTVIALFVVSLDGVA